MEKIRVSLKIRSSILMLFCLVMLLTACSSKFLKHDKADQLQHIDEFDNKVKIIETEEVPVATGTLGSAVSSYATATTTSDAKASSNLAKAKPVVTKEKSPEKSKGKTSKAQAKPLRRQPELESDLGFDGRRPLKDPIRVGEKVVHSVDYFKVSVGTLTFETKPFASVNGKKSYHFEITALTSNWYSGVYRVEDKAKILMDFETLVPSVYSLHVKETSQLKEARMLFEGNKATYWEKKVTEKSGVEEKKQAWDIEEYTQSLYSAAYYMRFFTWEVGKEIAFRVADDNDNMIFKGQAVRKEKLKTKVGEFNTVVVKPQVELKGKFKQSGDIFMWLSDDDRKLILRIEAKIKIGSFVSEVTEIQFGNP